MKIIDPPYILDLDGSIDLHNRAGKTDHSMDSYVKIFFGNFIYCIVDMIGKLLLRIDDDFIKKKIILHEVIT